MGIQRLNQSIFLNEGFWKGMATESGLCAAVIT